MIFPLLSTLVVDDQPLVRQHLAEQVRCLAEICKQTGGAAGYAAVCDTLLPLIARLVNDVSPEVRVAAGAALVGVAPLIARDELALRVLTIVLTLAHDDDSEDLRMSAAVLLNELSDTMGPELCVQFVLPEVICLAEDPVFRACRVPRARTRILRPTRTLTPLPLSTGVFGCVS